MLASSSEMSIDDDGPSHTNTLQEKVLTKEMTDIPVKHNSKSAKFSPRKKLKTSPTDIGKKTVVDVTYMTVNNRSR